MTDNTFLVFNCIKLVARVVSRVRKFAVVLLALVICGSPALACLTPGADLTPEERECCEQMAQQCGSMDSMPASHSCCRTEIQQPNAMLQARQVVASPVLWAALPAFESASVTLQIGHEIEASFFHPPPDLQLSELSILRI